MNKDYDNRVHPHYQKAIVGENVTYVCFNNIPVSWGFNSGKLPENAIRENLLFGSVNNTLILTEVQMDNTGIYTCKGKDRDSNEFVESGYLKVDGKFAISTLPYGMFNKSKV